MVTLSHDSLHSDIITSYTHVCYIMSCNIKERCYNKFIQTDIRYLSSTLTSYYYILWYYYIEKIKLMLQYTSKQRRLYGFIFMNSYKRLLVCWRNDLLLSRTFILILQSFGRCCIIQKVIAVSKLKISVLNMFQQKNSH